LNYPEVGAHIYHPNVTGEKIVPMCKACNKKTGEFSIPSVTTVPANKAETCEKDMFSGMFPGV
jgi:hypothetical protein